MYLFKTIYPFIALNFIIYTKFDIFYRKITNHFKGNDNMLIGMMSRSKRPPLIAKATSLIATNYGIRLIYFTPWDVDLKQKKIKEKVYEKHKWRNVTENIPPLIDIQSRCFRRDTRPIVDGLRKYSVFTFDRANTPSKLKLQNALLEDQEFEKFVIPTKRLEDINSL